MDEILDGSFDLDLLRDLDRPDIDILLEFVKQMAQPLKNGAVIPDMEWQYGPEEYRDSFSKKSEDTSCSPSGLHTSHWKVACDDEELCALHTKFIEIAFELASHTTNGRYRTTQ